MNNQKMNPIQALVKLFQASGQAQTIERNLKAASIAEAYYNPNPMPRI
ncbi:MAG: hypothetical protein K2N78_11560 [Oscillospiraceae bacterium]|nr:hypothetical protein [Oscillospiraceae bacterium]